MGRSYCEACISGTRGSDCLGSKSSEVGGAVRLGYSLNHLSSAAGPLRVPPPMAMAWVVLVVLRQHPCRRQKRPMPSLHGSRTGHPKQNPQDDFHWLQFFGKHFVWKTTDYQRTLLFWCVCTKIVPRIQVIFANLLFDAVGEAGFR